MHRDLHHFSRHPNFNKKIYFEIKIFFELLFLVWEEVENDFGTLWRRTGRDDDIRTPLPRTLFNRSSYFKSNVSNIKIYHYNATHGI